MGGATPTIVPFSLLGGAAGPGGRGADETPGGGAPAAGTGGAGGGGAPAAGAGGAEPG